MGLLLKQGSLHVYIKGQQVSTLCTGLAGEFVWATDLYDIGASMRIARKPRAPYWYVLLDQLSRHAL